MSNKLFLWMLAAAAVCLLIAGCLLKETPGAGQLQADNGFGWQPVQEQQAVDADTEISADLADFLKSGTGDMKAGNINGIDPKRDKVVALTFDDGPMPSTTSKILDTLARYNARATFFLLGNHVEQFPVTTRKIYQSGNEIGNHSFDHKDFKTISTEEMMEEINETSRAIFETVGARPILIRPPYGNITQKLAGEIGRPCILWTVDSEDWKYKDAGINYNNVMDCVRDGDIVLLHDIYNPTAAAVERIVRELTDRGYKLVGVTQMIQIARARGEKVELIVRNLRGES